MINVTAQVSLHIFCRKSILDLMELESEILKIKMHDLVWEAGELYGREEVLLQ